VITRPRVLITGIAGQDGSLLAELLCAEGAEVHGALRGPLHRDLANLAAIRSELVLHDVDIDVPGALYALVAELVPDAIYHLAARAVVPESWLDPAATIRSITASSAELLAAVRAHAREAHVVIAGSREIFGDRAPSPQDERTPCHPTSPYGVAKLAAHQLVGLAREHDGLHASSAILFNHESTRRNTGYVSRKVTRAAAAISLGLADELVLGDLDAVRDWSAAKDVVRGLRAMAVAALPDDYVLASGVGRTVRELVEAAFAVVDLDPSGYVRVDERLVRPAESSPAVGNPARARERLGWSPQISFSELIGEMVAADLLELRVTQGLPR
jgi:GDPmannose 4,6-dehydratase